MKNIIVFAALLFISNQLYAQSINGNDRAEILHVLEQQRLDWNNGDLEKYMEGYWKSDSLRFIGKNGISYGWDATLKTYKKSYPDKSNMGHLTFDVISIESLGENSAFMIGKWVLDRKGNNLGGHFTLIWKRINGSWLITVDHSS